MYLPSFLDGLVLVISVLVALWEVCAWGCWV